MQGRGLEEMVPWSTFKRMVTVVVKKTEGGWCAQLKVLDRKALDELMRPLVEKYKSMGLKPPTSECRAVHTTWMNDQMKGQPFFSVQASCPVDAKSLAAVMFMYGAKPRGSKAYSILRKTVPRMLDIVTGIVGDRTLILTKEVTGARINFSLPAAGFLPPSFPLIISRLCGNRHRGECSLCGSKRFKQQFVYGANYPCGHFVHDFCAIENYWSYAELARKKVWHFYCGCGRRNTYTSPSRLFDPIRLTVMTGDNVDALKNTIEKYRVNGENVSANVDGDLLFKGIRSMLNNVQVKRHQFKVPNLETDSSFYLNMPKGSKAGAFFQSEVHEFVINNEIHTNKQNPEKTTVTVIAGAYLRSYICALKEEFREYVAGRAPLDGKKLQEFAWSHLFVYKVNTKVEAIYAVEENADKIRCFFPAHVCKFMLDNLMWKELAAYLYGKGAVMLGFKWVHGGAKRIFDRLKMSKKIFAWDISGLDSSMKARLIQTIFLALFHCYDPSSVPDDVYKVFTMLYHISVGHYVSKIVSWVDGFRIMVGAMASGELMTSIFNTLYCIVAVLCWIHHCGDLKFGKPMTNKRKQAWIKKNISDILLYIFGDDGLMGTDADELELFEDVKINGVLYPSLTTYLQTQWYLKIKVEESTCFPGRATGLLSTPDSNGDLPPGSITILKRGLVEVMHNKRIEVLPFKSTTVSIGKLVKNEVPLRRKDDLIYTNYLGMCRSIGHAIDTCGTNDVMYDVCKYYYDVSLREFLVAWNTGAPTEFSPTGVLHDTIEERLIRTFGVEKIPMGDFSVTSFPPKDSIIDLFVYRSSVDAPPTELWKTRRLKRPDLDPGLLQLWNALCGDLEY